LSEVKAKQKAKKQRCVMGVGIVMDVGKILKVLTIQAQQHIVTKEPDPFPPLKNKKRKKGKEKSKKN